MRITQFNIHKAILNWQDAVGTELNGQLEAYLGFTLGRFYSDPNNNAISEEQCKRINMLLNDNHKTMIKVYLAKQD